MTELQSKHGYGWVWSHSPGGGDGPCQIVFVSCKACLKRTAAKSWGSASNAKWALSGCPGDVFFDSRSSSVLYIVSEAPCSHTPSPP